MNGVLVVDKPRGPTSHDIVAQARKLYGTRSIGHAGTLDPMATGVLVVLVGEATKLSAYLTANEKQYVATIRFGVSTDSLDAEGTVVRERSLRSEWLSPKALERALAAERQRTEQVPPAFSAVKVGGVRAHRAARGGNTLTLAPRAVSVREIAASRVSDTELELALTVSKGYYVRSLARDVCEHLGVEGHLSALRRVASGPFHVDEACAWPPAPGTPLIPMADAARRAMPSAVLTPEGTAKARVGKPLTLDDFAAAPGEGPAAWCSPEGELVAIGEARPETGFAVLRGFRVDAS